MAACPLQVRRSEANLRSMAFAPFVPLRVLSSYSMLEGAIDPKAIARLAKQRGFPAIAICDRNGLYGSMAFAKACVAEGVQPIVGTLLGVVRGEGEPVDYLPLYAQDERGWENLCHLVSRAHLERPLELEPHVALGDLEGHTDGLIALTGAGEGAVTRLLAEGKAERARATSERLAALFPGRLYVELARRGHRSKKRPKDGLDSALRSNSAWRRGDNPANSANPTCRGLDAMWLGNSPSRRADGRAQSEASSFGP